MRTRCASPICAPPAQTSLRSDATDQDDFAPRLQHAGKFIKRSLGVGNRGDDILRHNHVEAGVRKGQALRVHHPEPLDVGKRKLLYAVLRLAQHRLGKIDTADAIGRRIVWKRDACTDSNFKNAPADAFGRCNGCLPAALKDSSEDQIVDGGLARVGLCDRFLVELDSRVHAHLLAALSARGCRHPQG